MSEGAMPGPDRRMNDLLPSPRGPGASSPHDPPVWCMPDALIAQSGDVTKGAKENLSAMGAKDVKSKKLGEGLDRLTWKDGPEASQAAVEIIADMGLDNDELSVDCIMVPAMMPAIGPATDPEPADPALLAGLQAPHGNVSVAIVDTGLYEPAGRLAGRVSGEGGPDPIDTNHDGVIDYAGACHGGAIAGIVASRIGADVTSYNALVTGHTFMCDSSVFAALVTAARGNPDVINMSWGSYRTDAHFPIATTTFVRNHDEILFVAAAGNDGMDHPWYPAALAGGEDVEHVVSVGAYDTTGPGAPHLAAFSNFGDWVNAYAPGVDVVTDYVSGLSFRYDDGSEKLMWGAAYWSGTSFAAPAVLAAIVAATGAGETPLDAWGRLQSRAPLRLT